MYDHTSISLIFVAMKMSGPCCIVIVCDVKDVAHNNNTNNNHSNIHIVVSYSKGLIKGFLKYVVKWESKSTLREVVPSEASWWPQMTRITLHREVYSYTCVGVAGMNVMRST